MTKASEQVDWDYKIICQQNSDSWTQTYDRLLFVLDSTGYKYTPQIKQVV